MMLYYKYQPPFSLNCIFENEKAILVFQRCFPNVQVHSSLGSSTRPILVDCGKVKKQRTIVSLTGGSYFNSVRFNSAETPSLPPADDFDQIFKLTDLGPNSYFKMGFEQSE